MNIKDVIKEAASQKFIIFEGDDIIAGYSDKDKALERYNNTTPKSNRPSHMIALYKLVKEKKK